MNGVTANPFANIPKEPHQTGAMVEVEQQRAIAETQAAMILAKRFPRDQLAAMDRILMACARPSLAESSLYTYNKGGSDVTGPSIRLAEAIAQNWGNINFGIRELEQREGESTVEAFAWDIETNTRQVKVFQVAHERHTRRGVTKLTDPRDIYELVANQGARRLRACILGIIPGDVIESAVKQCEMTMKAQVEITPDLISNLVTAFAAFGVTKEQMETRIQRRIDTITPALVVQLRKIYNSLKDGMSSPADWFDGAATGAPGAGNGNGKPAYPADKFDKELPKWKNLVQQNKKTPADIIAMVESGNALSDEQRAAINALTATAAAQEPQS